MVSGIAVIAPRPTANLWTELGLWTTPTPPTALGLPFRPTGTDPDVKEQP
jgi:hypothetical protein